MKQDVAIISGGGSGHEPADIGYVGKGMLYSGSKRQYFHSAYSGTNCDGNSPRAKKIKSILFIIKNFKDDVESFLAAEQIKLKKKEEKLTISS